ncbi:hypothetical protein [Halalkalibacter sp. APA_J-10(15)]|uniref:hypothetical protein n=1 Tax=Halalkalibacter sp. APA_J-10(15) TaxID=2933805 RepID=UPI001FF45C62|nr:hypothetical protein [Halalkalibacter sp. APA_J-10(15)]MCK0470280.1 hypothetical protein [Halalkalibacter sp. APA_J-10(15)]
MNKQFDKSLKALHDNIQWRESRKKKIKYRIKDEIEGIRRNSRRKHGLMYVASVALSLFIIFLGAQYILDGNSNVENNYGGEDKSNVISHEHQEMSDSETGDEEKIDKDEVKQTINNEIYFGHSTMNGYVMYGWDHDNFNLENLKGSMEYRIPNIKKAIEVTEDPYLKKDFEDIEGLLLELGENMDNEEIRNRIVKELQKIYRDLDYYYRSNDVHAPTNVSHYGKSKS